MRLSARLSAVQAVHSAAAVAVGQQVLQAVVLLQADVLQADQPILGAHRDEAVVVDASRHGPPSFVCFWVARQDPHHQHPKMLFGSAEAVDCFHSPQHPSPYRSLHIL